MATCPRCKKEWEGDPLFITCSTCRIPAPPPRRGKRVLESTNYPPANDDLEDCGTLEFVPGDAGCYSCRSRKRMCQECGYCAFCGHVDEECQGRFR